MRRAGPPPPPSRRRWWASVALWLLPLALLAAEPAAKPDGAALRQRQQAVLLARFDGFLKQPEAYRQRALREGAPFPEGDLFPFTFPVLGYVNVALREPERREHAARQAAVLLDLALPRVVATVQPPHGRLEELTDYRQHATYLGEYALALGAYGLLQHDPRFAAQQGHLADLLYSALAAAPERPLRSYPAYFWPFDTLPVLLALQLDDLRTGRERSRLLIARHLAWVRSQATHPRYQLPWSRLTERTYRGQELPRGSDLAFRLCLLPHLEPAYARDLYSHFTHHYWLDQGTLAGFAEWPAGQQRFQDVDSGPIVMGVGVAATGLGIGAALAQDDAPRRDRLLTQLAGFGQMLPLLAASQAAAGNQPLAGVRFATEYTTGFLYGDAVLFYAVTWTPWPLPPAP